LRKRRRDQGDTEPENSGFDFISSHQISRQIMDIRIRVAAQQIHVRLSLLWISTRGTPSPLER
jgi:hypothetical protein